MSKERCRRRIEESFSEVPRVEGTRYTYANVTTLLNPLTQYSDIFKN